MLPRSGADPVDCRLGENLSAGWVPGEHGFGFGRLTGRARLLPREISRIHKGAEHYMQRGTPPESSTFKSLFVIAGRHEAEPYIVSLAGLLAHPRGGDLCQSPALALGPLEIRPLLFPAQSLDILSITTAGG